MTLRFVGCMNRKNMENETIKERFLGTIFGQVVGDALGLSTEFMSKQEVDRFYPNGIEDYSQIVQDDHRRRWQSSNLATVSFICSSDKTGVKMKTVSYRFIVLKIK